MSRLSPMAFDKLNRKIPPGRCTGQSTAIALWLISKSLMRPGEKFQIKDHFPSPEANRLLSDVTADYITRLGFDGFEFIKDERTRKLFIRFNPNGAKGIQFLKA